MIIVFGFVATTLTTLSILPQTIKTIVTRSTKDISLPMYLLMNIGLCFWITYGIFLHQLPIIIGNIITLVFCLPILIIAFINFRKARVESVNTQ
ncbi:MAG: SemiSWEET transporter [Candidatus Heimdallarchaeota archaeon]|nr:SemiSWEET transporter [Candidatus Heimdallarchaeota archaeon]